MSKISGGLIQSRASGRDIAKARQNYAPVLLSQTPTNLPCQSEADPSTDISKDPEQASEGCIGDMQPSAAEAWSGTSVVRRRGRKARTLQIVGYQDSGSPGYRANVPVLIAARFLKGLESSMNTIPMLKICTPPPDMYSMNACIGRDLAGENARSHARFDLSSS